MVSRGIIYVVTGRALYWAACLLSLRSLRRAGSAEPVIVVTDLPVELWSDQARLGYSLLPIGDFPAAPPPVHLAWAHKFTLNRRSPFAHTLYLDADTIIRRPLDALWAAAGDAPFAIAYDRLPRVQDVRRECPHFGHPADWAETLLVCGPDAPHYNCGVFAWRAGPAANALFDSWADEWEKHRAIDQPALSRALHRCGTAPRILPEEFNAQSLSSPSYVGANIRHFNWFPKADLLDLMIRFGDGISPLAENGMAP